MASMAPSAVTPLACGQASFLSPPTMRKLSQMRLPLTARWLPQMPGSRIAAGLALAGRTSASRRAVRAARVPLASSPAHDSGPIRPKPCGWSCISALHTASAVRSAAK